MQVIGRQPQPAPDGASDHYERHRPEQPSLYRLVQQHAAIPIARTAASTGREPPRFIKDEFDAFLDAERAAGKECKPDKADWLDGRWKHMQPKDLDNYQAGETWVKPATFAEVGAALTRVPGARATVSRP